MSDISEDPKLKYAYMFIFLVPSRVCLKKKIILIVLAKLSIFLNHEKYTYIVSNCDVRSVTIKMVQFLSKSVNLFCEEFGIFVRVTL